MYDPVVEQRNIRGAGEYFTVQFRERDASQYSRGILCAELVSRRMISKFDRVRWLGFDDLVPHGVSNEFAHRMNLQLAHDVRAVRLGCLYADAK